jgi:hypothetical protein
MPSRLRIASVLASAFAATLLGAAQPVLATGAPDSAAVTSNATSTVTSTAASTASLPALSPAARPAPAIDLTSTADLLSGREPASKEGAVRAIVEDPEWQKHRDAIHAASAKLGKRLALTETWRRAHLPAMGAGSTLLYPFSGPDFFNAFALFPDADTYVFFGLESPGGVPDLAAASPEHREKLYGDLRSSLVNLIGRNFFITSRMMKDLHTEDLHGTVPIMMAMMGLLDLQVVEVSPYEPWAAHPLGEERPADKDKDKDKDRARMAFMPRAVKIVFLNPRSQRRQTLLYVAADVTDSHLARMPDFIHWMEEFREPTVFLKAASYLLQGVEFKQVRRSILQHARVLVQDDTGVSYHLLRESGFEVTPIGQYERPIKDFEAYYQADLDEAFEKSGGGASLPFPFGYSWYKNGRSGLVVAVRTPAAR